MPNRLRLALLLVALALLGSLPGALRSSRAAVAGAPAVSLQQIAGGLNQPIAMASAGDNRMFIVEQTGAIRVFDGAQVLPTPFLNLSSLVSLGGERGLLNLAFHPNYASNGYFYVYYANADGNPTVARYSVSADPNVADPASAVVLVTIPHPLYDNHLGGSLAFGADGKLYIGVGDGGGGGDPEGNGQNLGVLLGKILRLDVDIAAPYVPASNPFVSTPGARGEIWAYGLRNPWRTSFDRTTGDFYIADVGQDTYEEVDFQGAASAGGDNYGWSQMEGAHCFNPPANCNPGASRPPAFEYGHVNGRCAVVGGYRYRGAAPGFGGTYVYGDLCTREIFGATRSGNVWSSANLITAGFMFVTFGQDSAGELYVADYVGGGLYRINVLDTDTDGLPDATDNCPAVANPGQQNADRNFVDLPPTRSFDDLTWVNSDNLGDACDADQDNDGLSNVVESGLGPGGASHAQCTGASAATNPMLLDSDGDRYTDGAECSFGTDPMNALSVPPPPGTDTDNDGLSNARELILGTDRTDSDTDNDGLSDGVEVLKLGSDPLNPNTDGDLCSDGKEVATVNSDTTVNSADLGLVASAFGPATAPNYVLDFDVNRDGTVNSLDLLFVALQYGPC